MPFPCPKCPRSNSQARSCGVVFDFHRCWEGPFMNLFWVKLRVCMVQLWNVLCKSHFFYVAILKPTMQNHFLSSSSLSFCLMNSGILPNQTACKKRFSLRFALSLKSWTPAVSLFEVKLQVYRGHPESTGSVFPPLGYVGIVVQMGNLLP